MSTGRTSTRWWVLLVWLVLTMLGVLLGFAIFFGVMTGLGASGANIPDPVAAFIMAICFGLPVGLAQWFILKRHLPPLVLWLAATLLAFLIASPFLLRWSGYFGPNITLTSALKMGSLLGALLGLVQCLVMPNRFSHSLWWIPISFATWLTGALAALLFKALSWSWGPILYWIGLFFFGTSLSSAALLLLARLLPAALQRPSPPLASPLT